jgi:hypothetical protein
MHLDSVDDNWLEVYDEKPAATPKGTRLLWCNASNEGRLQGLAKNHCDALLPDWMAREVEGYAAMTGVNLVHPEYDVDEELLFAEGDQVTRSGVRKHITNIPIPSRRHTDV